MCIRDRDYPETGYGYIRFNEEISLGQAYKAAKFVEKPDLETAKMYFESGQYLWNSGMFVWKVSSILNKMAQLMPEMYQALENISKAFGTEAEESVLQDEFFRMRSMSVDYGILEHAEDIYTVPGSFGWDDVGSWLAMERINPTNEFGNVMHGNLITVDTKNCILQGGEKLIATVGVQNLIVVDTPDAILICQKENAEDIKKVLENLRICDRTEYI
jgi:mannose-1-phosphate guanylyltransferase